MQINALVLIPAGFLDSKRSSPNIAPQKNAQNSPPHVKGAMSNNRDKSISKYFMKL